MQNLIFIGNPKKKFDRLFDAGEHREICRHRQQTGQNVLHHNRLLIVF